MRYHDHSHSSSNEAEEREEGCLRRRRGGWKEGVDCRGRAREDSFQFPQRKYTDQLVIPDVIAEVPIDDHL